MFPARTAATILRRSGPLLMSPVSASSQLIAVSAISTQRRFLLQMTPILRELKMSKRRLRPKHKPSLGFSVPVAFVAVVFTLYLIISIKSGSFEDAVNAKRTFF
jgi:hypothetical protein